jgi:hypothetical protein
MADYVFVPSGVRVSSDKELPAPLWAKADEEAKPTPKRRRAASKKADETKEG